MPGMAASPGIFEYIKLPSEFKIHKLSWITPKKNEAIESYAQRMSKKITHYNPIVLGVSFGGILVQEMSKFISFKKIIIISSIKNSNELPITMKMAKKTNIHKILPVHWIDSIDSLSLFVFGNLAKKKIKLYQKYLSFRNQEYLKWSINAIVKWNQSYNIKGIIHIHGKKDNVFPIKNLTDKVELIDGGHAIIITNALWFNNNLPGIIN
jgi:esterase/lipase